MSRRAGKLSLGHDAAKSAVCGGRAKLCVITADSSERLKREFQNLTGAENRGIPIILTDYTMYDIASSVGLKAAVLTVDDEGFGKRLTQLYGEKNKED